MAAVRNADEGQSVDISDENGARHLEERIDGLEDRDLGNKTEELDAKIDLKKKAEKNKLKGRRVKRRARNRKRGSRKNKRRAARETEALQKTKRPEKSDLEERFENLEITDQQD